MPEYEVIWEPQPGPQTALLAAPHFEVFFGGARGGGKTDGVLGDWISHQDQYGGHCIGLMVRRELTQLSETIERSKELFEPLGAKYHEQGKYWRFPNGSRLRFAYLERDSDANSYQGHSYTRVYVEEIGTFPSPAPIFKLMATLRSGHGIPCGFRATGNPGGPGHQWVRSRYVDPAPLGWQEIKETFENPWTKEKVTRERIYIPSKVSDNKFLGADYVANLQMAGSPQVVRAWLEGDWSVIDGAFFPEFSEAKHVLAPFTIPSGWLRFRSGDWGSARPFSIGWWAVCGDDYPIGANLPNGNGENGWIAKPMVRRVVPRGALIRYREWYGASSPNVGLKFTAEEVADGIVSRETDEPRDLEGKTAISYGVLDPACFSSDGGPSIAERMQRRKVVFRRADNARVSSRGAMGGWDQVRSRLIGDGERPMIYFFSTCRDAIRTFPAMQHDVNKPEDCDSEGEDHACFAAGTIVNGRPIEQIGVLTRCGTDVVRVCFDDGREVVCTPNHQFMDEFGQWISAKDLIFHRLSSAQRLRSSTANGIISAAFIFSAMGVDYIARCGNIIAGIFRKVTTSIIVTIAVLTMLLRIWSYLLRSIIYRSMATQTLALQTPRGLRLLSGMVVMKEGFGTLDTIARALPLPWQSARRWLANIAGNLSRHGWSLRLDRNSAATTAKPARCVSVEPLKEKQDVYCLGTSDGWLDVDGLVASNCDEIRYACMSRPYVKRLEQREPPRILGVGPHNQITLKDLGDLDAPIQQVRRRV